MFNSKGRAQAIFNGMGVTRTKQSQTLIVMNCPRGRFSELNDVFGKDPGFFGCRTVRSMYVKLGLKNLAGNLS